MFVSYLQFTYIKLNFPGNISKMSEFQPYNMEKKNNLLMHKTYLQKSILIWSVELSCDKSLLIIIFIPQNNYKSIFNRFVSWNNLIFNRLLFLKIIHSLFGSCIVLWKTLLINIFVPQNNYKNNHLLNLPEVISNS